MFDVSTILILAQIALAVFVILHEYKRKYSDLLSVIVFLGYLQFITIPLLLNQCYLDVADWYPEYQPSDNEILYLTVFSSLSIFLFIIFWKIVQQKLCYPFSGASYILNSGRAIFLLLLSIVVIALGQVGYAYQVLGYFCQGIAAYIFLVSLCASRSTFVKIILILMSVSIFSGSSVRIAFLFVAVIIFIGTKVVERRPNFSILSLGFVSVAIFTLVIKVVVKRGEGTSFSGVIDKIVRRLQVFDISNPESIPIAAHHISVQDGLLYGKTFMTATVLPWLFDESFVGMGKHYIQTIHGGRSDNPIWSLSYPYPLELLLNFGYIPSVFLFVLTLCIIGRWVTKPSSSRYFLWKSLFGLSLVYFILRGDFVFAFVPTVVSGLGGLFALYLSTTPRMNRDESI